MSAKFILLVVTTCLLVQSSFGRAVPEESLENDITPESTGNTSFSSEENSFSEKYVKFVIRQMLNFGQLILTKDKGDPEIQKDLAKIVHNCLQDLEKFYNSLTIKEKVEQKPFADFVEEIRNINDTKVQIGLFLNNIKHYGLNLFEKLANATEFTEKDIIPESKDKSEKVPEVEDFWFQESLNFLKTFSKVKKGEVGRKEAVVKFVNDFMQNAEEYYKTLTIEGDKKLFADFLDELKNINEVEKQIKVIVEELASDDEDEEKDA